MRKETKLSLAWIALAVTVAVIGGAIVKATNRYANHENTLADYTYKTNQKPDEKVHATANGQLIVMEVPVAGLKRATERQTCYVWRDSEYKSSSLQCPNDRRSYTLDPP